MGKSLWTHLQKIAMFARFNLNDDEIAMLGATSSINNFSNVFGVQSGLSMGNLAQTLMQTGAMPIGNMPIGAMPMGSMPMGNVPMDTLTISSSANLLQQFLNAEMQSGGDSADTGELDLMGLAQLKQRGEMLASMLQLKMKNFESHLVSNIQGAGLPMQEMSIKNGNDGLFLTGDMPNKEMFQNALGGLQGEFTDIAQLANVLNLLRQMGPNNMMSALSSAAAQSSVAAQYAQQSLPDRSSGKRPETDFVMHIMQSGTSYSFE